MKGHTEDQGQTPVLQQKETVTLATMYRYVTMLNEKKMKYNGQY